MKPGDNYLSIDNKETNNKIKSQNTPTLEEILEITGGSIDYINNKIRINDLGNSIELDINEDIVKYKSKDKIMVSESVFTEKLGYTVEYNNKNESITIQRPFQTMRLIVKSKSENIDLSEYEATKVIKGPDNIFVLQFDSVPNTIKCYESLLKNNNIEYVEPDVIVLVEDTLVTDDAKENINEKAYNYKSWGVKHIESDKYGAYLQTKEDSKSVTVAVVDTGIYKNHTLYKDRVADGWYDFVNKEQEPYDDHGHGTHVAGTVADNTQGLDTSVLSIKALNYNGSGSTLNIANGVSYAIEQGAEVINFSI